MGHRAALTMLGKLTNMSCSPLKLLHTMETKISFFLFLFLSCTIVYRLTETLSSNVFTYLCFPYNKNDKQR